MEQQVKQILELINQPAFLAKDGTVVWCNAVARSLFLDSASLSFLLGKSSMLYELWNSEGTLKLPLFIAGKAYDASVQRTDDGDLFIATRRSAEVVPSANAVISASANLRKPLHNMMSAANELFDAIEPQENERLSSASARLNQSIYQFLRICGQMSDGGKLLLQRKPVHRRPTDLSAFFSDFVAQARPLVSSVGIELLFDAPVTNLRADVDTVLLERALYNLISNALNYTHKGGTVTLSLKKQSRMLLISITDDGEGISADVLSTLFERFSDHGLGDARWGAGLGLPMAREIARLHGGDLAVSPNPTGKGTCVSFTLSLEPAPIELRQRGVSYDYSGGLNHGLLELSDVLDAQMYNPKEI